MAAHLRACAALDRQIRSQAQQRSVFDPELRRLRGTLRTECEKALLADLRLSQRYDAEQLMWKACFYRPIEDFRRRIKQQADSDLRDKTTLAYCVFLEEGKAFYLQLCIRLQQRYGAAGFATALAEQHLQAMGLAAPLAVAPAPAPADCRAAVHRCLICIGDLCRYQGSAQPAAAPRGWSECRHFYSLAARIYPEGGNAHNQLAVLATYEGDDLGAAYWYFRALAVAQPFAVARENLVTHFDQVKAANERLPGGGGGGGGARGMRPATQALRELGTRYARALGMLLTRDSLDALPAQLAAAHADLSDHLLRLRQQSRKAAAAAAAAEHQPPVLEQLATAAVYAAHVASGGGVGGTQQQAQQQQGQAGLVVAVQQQLVQRLALQLVFSLAASLAETAAAAAAGAASKQGLASTASGLLLLPPLHLLLRWLAAAGPDVLLPPEAPTEPADLAAARVQLWQAGAALVGVLRRAEQEAAAAAATAASAGASTDLADECLPEDSRLAGFLPLCPADDGAQQAGGAAHSAGSAAAGSDGAAIAAARLRRMLADAAAVAAVLAGSTVQQQPALAEAHAAFVQAAAAPQPWLQLAVQQAAAAAEALPPAGAAAGEATATAAAGAGAAEAAAMDWAGGEEEYERILFAPLARPSPAQGPPPAAAVPAAATPAVRVPRQLPAGSAAVPAAALQVPPMPRPAPAPAAAAAAPTPAPAALPAPAPATAGAAVPGGEADWVVRAVVDSALPPEDRIAPAPVPPPPAQRQVAPAGGEAGAQLPSTFFSLFGGPQYPAAQQQQQQQQQLGLAQLVPPAAPVARGAGSQPAQQQPAVGLRSLLFGGGTAAAAAATPHPLPQQQVAPQQAAPLAGGGALLSGGNAQDRWAWLGAFGGSAAPPASPSAGQQQAQGPPTGARTDNPFVA